VLDGMNDPRTSQTVRAYRSCVESMERAVGKIHAERACGHVKAELLLRVAEARCPEQAEAVVALCGGGTGAGLRGGGTGGLHGSRACNVARVALDECLRGFDERLSDCESGCDQRGCDLAEREGGVIGEGGQSGVCRRRRC